MHTYSNDGSRVLLRSEHTSSVIAVATDRDWARIITTALNQTTILNQKKLNQKKLDQEVTPAEPTTEVGMAW